jgi:Uma2 family endonuclease
MRLRAFFCDSYEEIIMEITLNFGDLLALTDAELERLSSLNSGYKLERNAKGELIMSPTFFHTGRKNFHLCMRLGEWNEQEQLGECTDSSAGFTLPSKAVRSPDAAWLSHERIATLSEEQLNGFAPIAPDFVVELMSVSDRLATAQDKMLEWMEAGTRLGWLIDPSHERAYIYRAGITTSHEPELVEGFDNVLSGEGVLLGFQLQLVELR